MAKQIQSRTRKAVKTIARKARARRSDSVMKPEYLALLKNSEEGRRVMCKAMEEFGNRREARGRRETMLATAKRMLKDGVLALKDIARYSGLSLAQVKKLQASMA